VLPPQVALPGERCSACHRAQEVLDGRA